MALESTTENQDVQTAAGVGLFSTIVQSAVQHAFYKFSHPQSNAGKLVAMEIVQHIYICHEKFCKGRISSWMQECISKIS